MSGRALLLAVLLGLLAVGAGSPIANTGGSPGGVRASDPDSGQGIPGAIGKGTATPAGQGSLGLSLGRVIDARGRGVEGVRITVVDEHGTSRATVVTGSAGTFSIPVTSSGVLVVEAPADAGPVFTLLALPDGPRD